MTILQLIAGFILLVYGADLLVKGASRIAIAAGITPLVVGLTVVAFGTSSPELAVSVISSFKGNSGIALGNVIGSNIFNVLFILGLSALITPLRVASQLIRIDVPIMIILSFLVLWLAIDHRIQFWEGTLLFLIGLLYTTWTVYLSRKEKNKASLERQIEELEEIPPSMPTWQAGVLVLAGLILLVTGSNWLVNSAVAIAKSLNISDIVIGLTLIAMGTSLPEVATSVVASLRGERDIAVGNVIGSNIFNIVFILGAAVLASPSGIKVPETAMLFDLPVMIAVAVACLPIFFTGRRLDRWEGFLFLGYYVAYTSYLIMANLKHKSLETFTNAMIWFVIPLTIITLMVMTLRELRKAKR